MKHHIIDGNNLIGKIKSLSQIQKRNKQNSREKLAFLIGSFFNKKRTTINLHFDGFENDAIKVSGVKIIYSGSATADEKIKREIERSKNPRNIILVTSDSNLAEFGRVCSCQLIRSEDFAKQLLSLTIVDEEQAKINAINSKNEFEKLFGLKDYDKNNPK